MAKSTSNFSITGLSFLSSQEKETRRDEITEAEIADETAKEEVAEERTEEIAEEEVAEEIVEEEEIQEKIKKTKKTSSQKKPEQQNSILSSLSKKNGHQKSIYLDDDIYLYVNEAAEEYHLSFSKVINSLLREYIKEH